MRPPPCVACVHPEHMLPHPDGVSWCRIWVLCPFYSCHCVLCMLSIQETLTEWTVGLQARAEFGVWLLNVMYLDHHDHQITVGWPLCFYLRTAEQIFRLLCHLYLSVVCSCIFVNDVNNALKEVVLNVSFFIGQITFPVISLHLLASLSAQHFLVGLSKCICIFLLHSLFFQTNLQFP